MEEVTTDVVQTILQIQVSMDLVVCDRVHRHRVVLVKTYLVLISLDTDSYCGWGGTDYLS